jgi:hypothetical protein
MATTNAIGKIMELRPDMLFLLDNPHEDPHQVAGYADRISGWIDEPARPKSDASVLLDIGGASRGGLVGSPR